MSSRLILLVALTTLLLVLANLTPPTLASSNLHRNGAGDDDDDEDLSFLDEPTPHQTDGAGAYDSDSDFDDDGGSYADLEDDVDVDGEDGHHPKEPEIDEKDVVVLKESNFGEFIGAHRFVMVEFYAPWCGHCQALAPEYAAAASQLKEEGEEVVLAKVDATEEADLAQEYDVQGFPTVLFFSDGAHKPYNGQRNREAIVSWIKKKTGPGLYNLTTLDEAEKALTSEGKLVLGYLNSLVGPESEELSAASRLEEDVSFYQTVNPDVAKLFHLDSDVKRPALVLLKKEAEKLSYFDGSFSKSEIAEFVFSNKLPLVTIFTRESAPLIFESRIKKQLILFAMSKDTEKVVSMFQEVSKSFKGKLVFVYVEMDNEDTGKPVSEYFGITGEDPKVLGYTGNEDAKKFVYDGEFSLDKIKAFAADFVEDKLKPFFKSDPIPETNDGDVKIVVGNNFDEIVLDESKDVLLEIYAPWCGHCQSLEPTYNKLAKHLREIDSLVIAKMDGTTNEHPRAKSDGFPTILFFPAGSKSFEPITVDTDRTVVALYKFIKKHASIPFKLQKPTSSGSKSQSSESKESLETSTKDVKDEL